MLSGLDDDQQDRFERAFAVFRRRFAEPLDALLAAAERRARAPSAYSPEELRGVVFGAYAGLSRMGGGNLEARVRQTAIARLAAMARAERGVLAPVESVLRLALGDPHAAVRKLALESLAALGIHAAALGAEALAVGHRDMGVAGLKLLAERGEGAARQRVLEQVQKSHTDGLEEEAQKLLAEQVGWVSALSQGLTARSQALRERSVAGLAQRWIEGEPAQPALRGALASRYRHVADRRHLAYPPK